MRQRIRSVKPELFQHEALHDLELETGLPIRLIWIGLFTCCDREGRFEWRPRTLKALIAPYDDTDIPRVLDALWTRGFLVRYTSETRHGETFGAIPSWKRHQLINGRETKSELPDPHAKTSTIMKTSARVDDAIATRDARVDDVTRGDLIRSDLSRAEYVTREAHVTESAAPPASVEDDAHAKRSRKPKRGNVEPTEPPKLPDEFFAELAEPKRNPWGKQFKPETPREWFLYAWWVQGMSTYGYTNVRSAARNWWGKAKDIDPGVIKKSIEWNERQKPRDVAITNGNSEHHTATDDAEELKRLESVPLQVVTVGH